MLSVCEEEKQATEALGYQEQIDAAYSGLAKIREPMLARANEGKAGVVAQRGMRIAQLQEEIARDKQALQALRADAKTRVAQLEALLNKQGSKEEVMAGEKEYIEGSRALFGDIAKGVREFLARLYQESEQELGPAPCKYTVMGLGSMALEQMTPYSDLEFAILMEEAKDTATAREYKDYLRQLTHLVHFRVINLGETTIPMSKYKISLDHLAKRGLNFDLGGKTPLGRKDKFYDLIQPVGGMLRHLKNEGNKIEHIDKLLPFILESTCYVHGDEGLHEAYAGEKSEFLAEGQTAAGLPVYKARALKKLLEGVVEMDYSKPGVAKARPKQGDLADFEPQFGYEDAGRLYDVKQEIYRLPDRLLYRLAMYYSILPESGWDAVEQLASKGIIGVGSDAKEAVHHLQYIVSFATMLRLRTYLHHGQQAERVTMLTGASQQEATKDVQEMFLLPSAALEAGGSLFKYYYTALPLHSKMEAFFRAGMDTSRQEEGLFQAEAFYDDSDQIKGDIHLRLLNCKAAIVCYERALAIYEKAYGLEHPQVAKTLSILGYAWSQLGDWKHTISYCERALAIYEQAYGSEHPHVAMSLNNLGYTWNQLGDPKQAISYLERALAIEEKVYGPEHPDVAISWNNLGTACGQLEDWKHAISYFERALAIDQKIYGSEHLRVTTRLNNLGYAWNQLGDPKQAISYSERALAISEKVYGPEHPHVAMSLNNLGEAWRQLGDLKQAISYSERALAIYKKAYGEEHPHVAAILNNLGLARGELGKPKEAISYAERALAINEQVYGPEHPRVATNLSNLGGPWDKLGDPRQAISYFERAFHTMKKAYGEHHPDTQTIKRNMEQLSSRLANNVEYQTNQFIQACVAGNEGAVASIPINLLSKDCYDEQGNPLISWMAQHAMTATLAQVLQLGWNPNLPNTSQVYPLHYGAMKNPGMVRLLLPYADPFVQTAKGSTPAMVAKSKSSMESLSLLLPSITGLSLQDPASFDASYETCKAHFLATPIHSFEHLVQVFTLACHFKDWELAREVATRHNLRYIISQVTQQYPAAGKSLLACIDSFTKACKEGQESLKLGGQYTFTYKIAEQFTFEKDLYDAQGNPLIGWMAQHEMMATLEQVLKLGWNPNLPNTSHVYPLHYGAMKNPTLTRRLLQAGAHPFVQTAKGNTPAQVARSKGKIATLAVLLPPVEGISFKDVAAFEESYQAYKQHFPTRHPSAEELLAALEMALQLGDADLTLAIQAKQASQNLLGQLIGKYPLATEAIHARFESMLP